MSKLLLDRIFGALGAGLLMTFIFGLAASISSGFAGFWGGLPFWVISVTSMVFVVYDYWDSCYRNRI